MSVSVSYGEKWSYRLSGVYRPPLSIKCGEYRAPGFTPGGGGGDMRRPNGGARISNGGGGMKPWGMGAGMNGGGGMNPGIGGIIGDPAPASMWSGELAVPFIRLLLLFSTPFSVVDMAVNFLRNTAASDRDSSRRRSVCRVASHVSCARFSRDRICVLWVASCTSTSFFSDSLWDLKGNFKCQKCQKTNAMFTISL